MTSTMFFLIGILMASIAITALSLTMAKKIKPKMGWTVWTVAMILWLICMIVGWSM